MFPWGLCKPKPQTPVPTARMGHIPNFNWCEHKSVHLMGTKLDICVSVLAIGSGDVYVFNILQGVGIQYVH